MNVVWKPKKKAVLFIPNYMLVHWIAYIKVIQDLKYDGNNSDIFPQHNCRSKLLAAQFHMLSESIIC